MDSHNDARRIRLDVVRSSYTAGKGHIGSCLSIVDIALAISDVVRGLGTRQVDRDRVVLSKGHAALTWYCTLAARDVLPRDVLASFGKDGSRLGTHPDRALEGVDFSTGSLGQGVGFAVGAALGARLTGRPSRVFVVMSDAELNEGSTWESLMLAAQLRLSNLVVVLDRNDQQALGKSDTILATGALDLYLESLGWSTVTVDGHDAEVIRKAIQEAPRDQPRFVSAITVSGYGVSFMEGSVDWHYLPLNEEQYRQAMMELGGAE